MADGAVRARTATTPVHEPITRASARRQRLTPLPAPRPEPVPHLTHPVASGAVGGIQSPAHQHLVNDRSDSQWVDCCQTDHDLSP